MTKRSKDFLTVREIAASRFWGMPKTVSGVCHYLIAHKLAPGNLPAKSHATTAQPKTWRSMRDIACGLPEIANISDQMLAQLVHVRNYHFKNMCRDELRYHDALAEDRKTWPNIRLHREVHLEALMFDSRGIFDRSALHKLDEEDFEEPIPHFPRAMLLALLNESAVTLEDLPPARQVPESERGRQRDDIERHQSEHWYRLARASEGCTIEQFSYLSGVANIVNPMNAPAPGSKSLQ